MSDPVIAKPEESEATFQLDSQWINYWAISCGCQPVRVSPVDRERLAAYEKLRDEVTQAFFNP